jgi:hypothetical protein
MEQITGKTSTDSLRSFSRNLTHIQKVGIVMLGIGALVALVGYLNQHHGLYLGQFLGNLLADCYANISTELASIAITVLIIDYLVQKRDEAREKRDLILQMGSPDNAFAIEAVRKLRARGWGFGTDKSLERVNLQAADLEGADQETIRLEGSKLWGANLRAANLKDARLEGTDLECANLENTNLWGANLEGANLEKARVTAEQLSKAKSLTGTRLPDGISTKSSKSRMNHDTKPLDWPGVFIRSKLVAVNCILFQRCNHIINET